MGRCKQTLLKTVPRKASCTEERIRKVASSILAQGTKIFVAPGEHSFSLFPEENIPWSICVLLNSPLLNISEDELLQRGENKNKTLVWSKMFYFVFVETNTLKNVLPWPGPKTVKNVDGNESISRFFRHLFAMTPFSPINTINKAFS